MRASLWAVVVAALLIGCATADEADELRSREAAAAEQEAGAGPAPTSGTPAGNHVKVFGEGGEACASCHIPHVPEGELPPEEAARRKHLLSSVSALCTSCHDGTEAAPCSCPGGEGQPHHPVGIEIAGAPKEIGGLKLFLGKIECATCHYSHQPEAGAGHPLLRIEHNGSESVSKLCTPCHAP